MEKSMKTYQEAHTRYGKSFNGWKGETLILDLNGYDWQITTSKGNKGLHSTAQAGCSHDEGDYRTFKFQLFSDPNITLVQSDKRCTEKMIKDLHATALIIFDQKVTAGELPSKTDPDYEIKPGQRIFLDNPQTPVSNLVIYNIEKIHGELFYQFVNIDNLALGQTAHLDNYEDKFGIGYYYRKDEFMDIDQVNNLVIEAKAKQKLDRERKEQENDAVRREIEKKIVEGKKLVTIPNSAKAVIVAHFKEDKSDMQSDYFAHHTVKTVYLAYSSHTRDLFPEMRKAASRFNQTSHLTDAPEAWEHREKYSMGSGYYLGESHHHGWEIRKATLYRDADELNKLYIAAAEGRYFCEAHTETGNDHEQESLKDVLSFHETKHTKKGHDLFVVKIEEQLDRDTFIQLKERAKSHNGYYSSYRGHGAIPGFHFLDKDHAQSFFNEL